MRKQLSNAKKKNSSDKSENLKEYQS